MNPPIINPWGFNATMYFYSGPRTAYSGGGAPANINATPVNNISDGTLTITPTKADDAIRGQYVKTMDTGLSEYKYEFTMFDDVTDPNFVVLLNSFIGITANNGVSLKVSAVVLDQQPTNLGSWGVASEWKVTNAQRDEKVDGKETIKFTLEACRPNNPAVPTQIVICTT